MTESVYPPNDLSIYQYKKAAQKIRNLSIPTERQTQCLIILINIARLLISMPIQHGGISIIPVQIPGSGSEVSIISCVVTLDNEDSGPDEHSQDRASMPH